MSKTVVSGIQFKEPTTVLNLPNLGQVTSNQVNITDYPSKRYLILFSKDPRVTDYLVLPYENVKAIRYTNVEESDA